MVCRKTGSPKEMLIKSVEGNSATWGNQKDNKKKKKKNSKKLFELVKIYKATQKLSLMR